MSRSRKAIAFELLVTVGLFALPALLHAVFYLLHPDTTAGPDTTISWRFAESGGMHLLMIGLVWHVARLNGETLKDFTLPLVRADAFLGLALAIGAYLVYYLAAGFLTIVAGPRAAAQPRAVEIFETRLTPWYLLLAILNPFAEEWIVRGFFQTRLRQAAIGGFSVVLLSTTVQTSYHLYQGVLTCLSLAPGFLLFAAYYQATRRLWPVITAHLIMDLVAMLSYAKN